MRLEPTVPSGVLAEIRGPFLAARAVRVDPAVLQPLGVVLDLAGEEMRSRLFVVPVEGGDDLCMRPDFTLPIALHHLESGAAAGRYSYDGKAFRVAPPGSDRAEDFHQIGIEAYGDDGDPAQVDAKVCDVAWRASLAGGRKDLSIMFGDVGLFAAFVDSLALAAPLAARLKRAFARPRLMNAELSEDAPPAPAPSRLADLLISLPEGEAAGVLQELWALAGVEPVGGRSPAEIVHRLAERAETQKAGRLTSDQIKAVKSYLNVSGPPPRSLNAVKMLAGPKPQALNAALEVWERRLKHLADEDVPLEVMTLSTAFGRDFGYYDGVLFEVRSKAQGDDRPVAAGGRYDGLPARLGSKATGGAVGCMVRPARACAETEYAKEAAAMKAAEEAVKGAAQ